MARRRKKSSKSKTSKKKRRKLLTLAVVAAVALFAFWAHHFQPFEKHLKGRKPKKSISRPTTRKVFSGKPKIVFVLDDIGNTNHHKGELEKLGRQVTYAILPLLPHSGEFDRLSRKTGAEVILHLPMESAKGTIPGPGLITSSMSDEYVLDMLRRNLASVPHASGVNNHMGSKGTADERLMRLILRELKSRGLFFLDSKTTSRSKSLAIAKQIGTPRLTRDEFLDNVDSMPAIREEVRLLAARAQSRGYAVGIGHYRMNTMKVLQEEIPRLKKSGFEIISLKDLLEYKRSL